MPVTISRYSIGNDRGARSTSSAARADTTRTPAIKPRAVSRSSQARPGPRTSRSRTWSQVGQRTTTPGAWSKTRVSAMGPVRAQLPQRPMAVTTSSANTSWRGPPSPVPSVPMVDLVIATPISSRLVPCQGPRPAPGRAASSVAPVPLLLPGVAVVVVAEALPEARLVLVQEPDATDPLGALPQIQMRHQQPRRAAMLGLQLRTVIGERDPRLAIEQVLQRQVGAVAAVGLGEREV